MKWINTYPPWRTCSGSIKAIMLLLSMIKRKLSTVFQELVITTYELLCARCISFIHNVLDIWTRNVYEIMKCDDFQSTYSHTSVDLGLHYINLCNKANISILNWYLSSCDKHSLMANHIQYELLSYQNHKRKKSAKVVESYIRWANYDIETTKRKGKCQSCWRCKYFLDSLFLEV